MNTVQILYCEDNVIGVYKPAGIATQAPKQFDSLEKRLRHQLKVESGSPNQYLSFPHRLDRCVSGVILACLSKRSARLLSEQFASRKVTKTYVAVVAGAHNISTGTGQQVWRDFMRKLPDVAASEICGSNVDGAKQAVTQVEVLRQNTETKQSLLRLVPETGRMHQLRLQTASRGLPILGDSVYETGQFDASSECSDLTPRDEPFLQEIRLHAESIQFHTPRTGLRVAVKCPADDSLFCV